MNKLEERTYKKLVEGLGHNDVSPAAMARHMLNESRYVNESFIQMFTNYIIQMGTAHTVPLYLKESHDLCKYILTTLQELGLTGEYGRMELDTNEYLSV
jgi:hypothetical protein